MTGGAGSDEPRLVHALPVSRDRAVLPAVVGLEHDEERVPFRRVVVLPVPLRGIGPNGARIRLAGLIVDVGEAHAFARLVADARIPRLLHDDLPDRLFA